MIQAEDRSAANDTAVARQRRNTFTAEADVQGTYRDIVIRENVVGYMTCTYIKTNRRIQRPAQRMCVICYYGTECAHALTLHCLHIKLEFSNLSMATVRNVPLPT